MVEMVMAGRGGEGGREGGGIQQMAACCLAGTESWNREAEAVSDAPPSGHCQEPADPPPPPNPHAPTLLSSTPVATEAEVKNRGSLVTLHVKASCILRGNAHWKQTTAARLCNPDAVFFLPSPSY